MHAKSPRIRAARASKRSGGAHQGVPVARLRKARRIGQANRGCHTGMARRQVKRSVTRWRLVGPGPGVTSRVRS